MHFNRKTTELKYQNIIILPYFDQWQWMFAIELALKLRSQDENILILKLSILDKSTPKRFLKAFFGYSQVSRKALRDIKSQGVAINRYWALPFLKTPQITFNAEGELNLDDIYHEAAFPHIVNDALTTKLDNPTFHKIIKRHVSDVKITMRQLGKFRISHETNIYTVNGRFSKNKAIKTYFQNSNGAEVKILESGAQGKYEILDNAQSMTEWQDKILSHWSNSQDPDKLEISESYFTEKARRVSSSDDDWTSRMTKGFIPQLDTTKRICTFYSTTEIEFIGGGGDRPTGEIGSQIEAIQLLRAKLPADEWELVVRRHPMQKDSVDDLDEMLTRKLSGIPNLIEISGVSNVDSYALADRSDLVTHYGSSIGAELVYRGNTPVYALGRTPWQYFDLEHHLITRQDIQMLDLNNLKKSEKQTVFPWSYYQLTGGIEFTHLELSEKFGWCLNGTPINVPFNSWVSPKFWTQHIGKQVRTRHG